MTETCQKEIIQLRDFFRVLELSGVRNQRIVYLSEVITKPMKSRLGF